MYSRHPDPRRVWKGGSEQHLLTPLPGAPGAPRAPGASSKKLDVAVFYNEFDTVALPFSLKIYMFMVFAVNLDIHIIFPIICYPYSVKTPKTAQKKISSHFSGSQIPEKVENRPGKK